MDRRRFLRARGVTAVGATLAGCMGSGGGDTGTLATRVSDQPGDIEDLETLVLRLTELRVAPSDGGTETDGEETIDIEDTEVDLTELTGGNTDLINESVLETGTYASLKLIVGEVVDARLTDGGEAEVTPGEAPLKFIYEGTRGVRDPGGRADDVRRGLHAGQTGPDRPVRPPARRGLRGGHLRGGGNRRWGGMTDRTSMGAVRPSEVRSPRCCRRSRRSERANR